MILRESVERALARAGTKERLKDQGVDPAVYEKARLTVKLDPREASEKVTSEDDKNVGVNLAVSGVLFFLIYISIFIYGAFIMRGVLEEKNNRIVEVIISSVKPTTLMLGKIIGIGLVGLTQYAVWGLFAFAITLPGIVGFMGLAGGAIPSIPGGTILAFVVFFLLGYFLYAGLYAALAAPFNTEQEAQQLVMIPGMMLILASTMWFFAFNSPDGTLARVLSLFPFTRPAPDVHADLGPAAAGLGDRPLDRDPSRLDLGRRLVRGAGLPGRDPDVRQEADAPRDHPLGAGRRLSLSRAGPGAPRGRRGRGSLGRGRGPLAVARGPVVQTPPSRGETRRSGPVRRIRLGVQDAALSRR